MGWSFHNNVSSKNSSTNLQYNSTNEDKMRVVKCSKRPSNGIVLCECKCPKAWTKYSIDCFTKKLVGKSSGSTNGITQRFQLRSTSNNVVISSMVNWNEKWGGHSNCPEN